MSDDNIFKLPVTRTVSAEEHANEESRRKRALFDWCDQVLKELGFFDRIAKATTLDELCKIIFNNGSPEVLLRVRDALKPASGEPKAACFEGLDDRGLRKILFMRFREQVKDREKTLSGGRSGASQARSWTAGLKFDDKGRLKAILANLVLILSEHPDWQGVPGYDEFGCVVVIRKRPPLKQLRWQPDATWSDTAESHTTIWFQTEWDINPSISTVGRAVQTVARSNPFHPAKERIESVEWDRVPRLETLFIKYFRAKDSLYVRAIGPRFMISIVARVYSPGCKVDTVVIFEGDQGTFKSWSLDALAAPWFSNRISNIADKDSCMEVAGVMIIEDAEMQAMGKATPSARKNFLTSLHDRYRPPYGKHVIMVPRSCVIVGTINPPADGRYLEDETGNRRFWPITCGKVDRDAILADRDQLFAEALVRFKAGELWWLETPELEALATAEQDKRFIIDTWTAPVQKWLERRKHKDKDVSLSEVMQGALKIEPRSQSPALQKRVVKILTRLGFKKFRARTGPKKTNKRQNRYRRTGAQGARK
jgi:predicted P-loop ATPase